MNIKKKHIRNIADGERLMLNLNYKVTRQMFDSDTEPENIVEVICVVRASGRKVFLDKDGNQYEPKDFQYEYKGYFYKNEDDITLWVYQ